MKYAAIILAAGILAGAVVMVPAAYAAGGFTPEPVPAFSNFWKVQDEGGGDRHRHGGIGIHREELKQQLEALPPEQRRERLEQLHEEIETTRAERREKFREEFQQRWDGASPEERAAFCAGATERCKEAGSPACDFAEKACNE